MPTPLAAPKRHLAVLLCSAIGIAAVPAAPQAQSTEEEGGVLLRFGLTLGAAAQSNRTLDVDDPGNSTEIFSDLSLGLSSRTRTQALSFDLGGRLRAVDAPEGVFVDQGLATPSAALRYSLTGARAQLNLSARYSEVDLADNSVLTNEDGSLSLLDGDATRRSTTLEARHDWNTDTRVRYGAFARYTDTRFSNGTATDLDGTDLNDTQRLTLGASATLDLTTAARLATTLSYSTFEEDGVDGERITWALNNALTIDRPLGAVTFSLGATDVEEGTRLNASVGRIYETPRATFSGEIGVAREVSGDAVLVGSAGVAYPLPRGALSFGLTRNVISSDTQDQERLNTQVSFGYDQELTPLSGFALDAVFAQAEDTATDTTFSDTTLSATYTRTLTRDWNMDTGLRHRFSDDDGIGTARSNEVFFNLRREFITRF